MSEARWSLARKTPGIRWPAMTWIERHGLEDPEAALGEAARALAAGDALGALSVAHELAGRALGPGQQKGDDAGRLGRGRGVPRGCERIGGRQLGVLYLIGGQLEDQLVHPRQVAPHLQIADVALFLASDAGSGVNGQVVQVLATGVS